MKEFAVNKRVYFDYEILETLEAGIELSGFEVKAVKAGRMHLAGAFVVFKKNEAYLLNASVAPYQAHNTPTSYDPLRTRRLLLHASEITSLVGKISRQGLTIVPIKVYTIHNRVKLLLGLARHKKKRDKREIIKKRESVRDIARAINKSR